MLGKELIGLECEPALFQRHPATGRSFVEAIGISFIAPVEGDVG